MTMLKFICSEKATKFCEIFPLLLTVCTVVKSKGTISQNFVAFSEYMNFIKVRKSEEKFFLSSNTQKEKNNEFLTNFYPS